MRLLLLCRCGLISSLTSSLLFSAACNAVQVNSTLERSFPMESSRISKVEIATLIDRKSYYEIEVVFNIAIQTEQEPDLDLDVWALVANSVSLIPLERPRVATVGNLGRGGATTARVRFERTVPPEALRNIVLRANAEVYVLNIRR